MCLKFFKSKISYCVLWCVLSYERTQQISRCAENSKNQPRLVKMILYLRSACADFHQTLVASSTQPPYQSI